MAWLPAFFDIQRNLRTGMAGFRQAAIIDLEVPFRENGIGIFQLRTSPCSVMRSSPEKSPGGCARMAA